MKQERNKDNWVKNDMMFICDGQGYPLTPLGQTVCIGLVDNDGNPLDKSVLLPEGVVDDAITPMTSDEVGDNPVTKHTLNKNYASNVVTEEIDDPITRKIVEKASNGKSYRVIEKELFDDGVVMSYRTIARRLQGVLPL